MKPVSQLPDSPGILRMELPQRPVGREMDNSRAVGLIAAGTTATSLQQQPEATTTPCLNPTNGTRLPPLPLLRARADPIAPPQPRHLNTSEAATKENFTATRRTFPLAFPQDCCRLPAVCASAEPCAIRVCHSRESGNPFGRMPRHPRFLGSCLRRNDRVLLGILP